MKLIVLEQGCQICNRAVKGNYEYGLFCAACNVLFRPEHLGLTKAKIERMMKKKEIDEKFSVPTTVVHAETLPEIKKEHEPQKKIITHFLASKQGAMVHASNCFFAKNIRNENTLVFSSLRDALDKGYKKCGCVN
ncbi:MAG: hypothetical protein Q7R76_05780 [Candidatus Woesearchaeota archaeon]|nr:hypothetical protein [Candidatus Woesearchaeota archaeon]